MRRVSRLLLAAALGITLCAGAALPLAAPTGPVAAERAAAVSTLGGVTGLVPSGGQATERPGHTHSLGETQDDGHIHDDAAEALGRVARAASEGAIQLNVRGKPFAGSTSYGTVRGLFDAHSHMMVHEAGGRNGLCAEPWSPQGPAVALQDCASHKIAGGAAAVMYNLLETGVTGTPTLTHDSEGWPSFTGWPAWNVVVHQQIYYRWLERAWRGGLRVYVMLAADWQSFCELNVDRTESCDETQGVIRQIKDTYALQHFIDERSGGRGKGWFRIVKNPFQARKVINQGKLAVVMGIETSQLFGCGQRNGTPLCDRADIDTGLDQMKGLGITSSFVSHKSDNALAGVAMDKGKAGILTNLLQKKLTGRFWDIETCKGPAHDEFQISMANDPFTSQVLDLTGSLLPTGTLPVYPAQPHCNKLGLTALGDYFVRAMVKRHMIVEVDHMSAKARAQTLDILEAQHYSGVISSHSWSDPPSLPRILRLGGIIAPMAGPATTLATESETPPADCCFLDVWKQLRDQLGIVRGTLPIGFADDMSGPSPQPPPRAPGMPTVTYPFRSFDGGTTVYRQHNGPRVYDINTDGVAHFGLFPDWWERLRLTAGEKVMRDLAAGAEGYLQMWERTVGVPVGGCLARRADLGPDGLGRLHLGATPRTILMRGGQPVSRPLRAFRYCAAGGRVAVVFDHSGHSQLLTSTAALHSLRGVRPGEPARALASIAAREVARGVFVAPLSERSQAVYVADMGRVRAVGVALGGLADDPAALLRSLHLAGVR